MFTGFAALFCFTTSAILTRWVQQEVTQFLTHLAVNEQVAATTQNQALNAIIFLYRVVLQQELVGIDAVRVKRSRYLPTVLAPDEVQRVISHLYGI